MARTSNNQTYKIQIKKIVRAALAEVCVNKKLAIISLVLYGVSFLLSIFDAEIHFITYHDIIFYPSFWATIFAGAGTILSYFTALNVFRDMTNKQLCDVYMALPVKASELFLSKLLCLVFIQIVPLLVSVLCGNGIKMLYAVIEYGNMVNSPATTLFTMFFSFLAASMFIMSIVVLSACCCGTFAESAYFSLILMVIINIMPMLFINNIICESACISINMFAFDNIVDLSYWGLIYLYGYTDDLISHCAIGCVISLIVMLLSGLIYIKRDAKTVGTPIVSRLFFEIIMFTSCMTIFSTFCMNYHVLWGVLIAGVIYVIINIIVSRAKISPLSFIKWAGKYIATVVLFTILLICTINTGGFGLINARPDAEYLDMAEFDIHILNYSNKYYYSNKYGTNAFISYALSADKADDAMDIIKKHLLKGRLALNTADIIFDDIYNDQNATISIYVKSDKDFTKKPSPMFMFEFHEYENLGKFWQLNYRQYTTISLDEADAMIAELIDGGYIKPDTEATYR